MLRSLSPLALGAFLLFGSCALTNTEPLARSLAMRQTIYRATAEDILSIVTSPDVTMDPNLRAKLVQIFSGWRGHYDALARSSDLFLMQVSQTPPDFEALLNEALTEVEKIKAADAARRAR